MRIFFFITKSEQGGAQTHVAQLARFFISRNDDVMIMSAPGGWLEKEAQKMGASFAPNAFLGNSANPLRLVRATQRLSQALKSFRPDLVTCHSTVAGLIGRFFIRNRIPTIFTAHGWGFTQGAPWLRRRLLPFLERLAGRFSSQIICVSHNDLDLAQRQHIAPNNTLTLIHNGVELQAESLKKPSDVVHIFFVGRLAPPKIPSLLLTAFSQLDPELQHRTHITIIGNGPDTHQLALDIQSHNLSGFVELAGALPHDQVLERLKAEADLFVLLSNWEGFPYSILEAMSAGVPVIASRVGGIPEALAYGGGILIDNHDPDQITRALAQLIHDPSLRSSMGITAQQSVHDHFSLEQMCQQTLAVYHKTLLQ
ncbi:hypothetical protein COV05_01835 [Candidatus Uhrbacteria bacterium CG10_big_fil_rev_8_21_14_0_10_48_16]|uniref:Glycosyltransferase family 1 protein n=1 Tax=Candidatus Uhrbacteria bacterium CG10_big_fil_rev_8_21_14_0_10_48_16 TaxID=1975038 RepID=A0A2M8LHK7_9BACT|nr:MAG: hypothetical protein COV05_01835 [Candidatus Uhrbacteria bacterium CG10_big_fil_rev_8_21_14_0_10_48_16]